MARFLTIPVSHEGDSCGFGFVSVAWVLWRILLSIQAAHVPVIKAELSYKEKTSCPLQTGIVFI